MSLAAAQHGTDWKIVVGVIMLLLCIIGVILFATVLDSQSRRERGVKRKNRKGGSHENGGK